MPSTSYKLDQLASELGDLTRETIALERRIDDLEAMLAQRDQIIEDHEATIDALSKRLGARS